MPRNGSGGYSRITPGTPYVAGTTIDEGVVNDEMDDLGNEIAGSLAKDGQTTPTANLPMGGYKHTGVANGSARTHYAAVGQVQDSTFTTGTVGGTADVITLTTSPAVSAYATGQLFQFVAGGTNTGATTLNVSSLGAKAVKRDVSVALQAGDIVNGGIVLVEYDGTNFQLMNPRTTVTQSASDNSTKPASTAYADNASSAAIADAIASQADQETGTSTTKLVTPGRQKFHPLSPKAWGAYSLTGATLTSVASSGIASMVRNSIGNVTVTMSTAMSSTSYCVIAHATNNGTNYFYMDIESMTTTTFVLKSYNINGSALGDAAYCSFMVFGDQ